MIAGDEIRRAAVAWLDRLSEPERSAATFPLDDPERFVWAFTPEPPRRGVAIGEMRDDQRAAAMAIVAASLSERASNEVATIMALETTLGALERASGRRGWERRDPDRYWFAVFGDPSGEGPWSWRIGGHHVAVHVTVWADLVVAATPTFLGANPAVVPSGPTAGARALTGEEALARALLATLTPEQRRVAVVDPVAPPDIRSGIGRRAELRAIPLGIRHDELDGPGRTALEGLVRHYFDRARTEVAEAAWATTAEAGLGELTFAWAGPDAPGRGHYYAVRGPRVLLEYDNTQNGANHIHAVWRDPENDWGDDVLAAHYRAAHPESPRLAP